MSCTWRSITPRAHCSSGSAALGLEDLHGVADRGQRVAQLVGQGRQELVLLAVGVAQRCSARFRSVMSLNSTATSRSAVRADSECDTSSSGATPARF